MSKIKNYHGKQFGNWKCLTYSRTANGETYWNCLCYCGTRKEVCLRNLRNGRTKSCGCRYEDLYAPDYGDEPAFNRVYATYKSHAVKAGRNFILTKELFREITANDCFYCGCMPSTKTKYQGYSYTYNGIDRVDNKQGYVPGNCVPACRSCNVKKGGVTTDMILKIYYYIYQHNLPEGLDYLEEGHKEPKNW